MSQIEIAEEFIVDVTEGKVSDDTLEELRQYIRNNSDPDTYTASEISTVVSVPEISEYRVELGKHVLPNELRTHKHDTFDWRFETREHSIKAWLTIRHPNLSDFLNDALTCAAGAATGSVLAAIFAGPAAGYALFYPVFKACLVVKVGESIASEIDVELDTEDFHGGWSGH